MLDRNRYYAIVYGDPVAKFYQDRKFYRGNGTPVDSKEPAKPVAKVEPQAVVVEQAEAQEDKTAALKDLHISKLKKLALQVAEANGVEPPPLTGKGTKAKLIAYIADNTE
jgi:hypothetical protein